MLRKPSYTRVVKSAEGEKKVPIAVDEGASAEVTFSEALELHFSFSFFFPL